MSTTSLGLGLGTGASASRVVGLHNTNGRFSEFELVNHDGLSLTLTYRMVSWRFKLDLPSIAVSGRFTLL
jgi:hypothetical protein